MKNDIATQWKKQRANELIQKASDQLVSALGAGRTLPYFWIAQEYVDGESLAQTLERIGPPGKLAWQHALRLAIHLGRALDFLRRNHLFHGNLTPRNVLIRLSDKQVKLNDLLLAKALEGSAWQKAKRSPQRKQQPGKR